MRKHLIILPILILLSLKIVQAETTELNEMNNTVLTLRQQAMVSIAATTASGDLTHLKTSLSDALDAGLTINEGKEILTQLYAYVGFPRVLNAIGVFMALIDQRKSQGIDDPLGALPNPMPADKTALQLGSEVQTYLVGHPVTGKLFEFVPAIDQFLKAHLFGDIFGRDNLNYQDREIVTISALAALKGLESQLKAHVSIGLNIKLTEQQIIQIATVLKRDIGKVEGQRVLVALDANLNK